MITRSIRLAMGTADLYVGDMNPEGAVAVALRLISVAKPRIETLDIQIQYLLKQIMACPNEDEEHREWLLEKFSTLEGKRSVCLCAVFRGHAMADITSTLMEWLDEPFRGGIDGI